jgi:Na+/proline symporter/signal transduction histidine kinase
MIASVDTIIFLGFLVVNIALGLTSSRGIKTIKEYAIGDRNFSTATIAATIVATWISGDFFFANIIDIYNGGLLYLLAATGDIFCILVISLFFAPRMGEFLGKLSIAEAMGSLYGKRVRVITAISGFLGIAGMIAVQLRIAGLTFEYAFNASSIYGILSAGIIISLYSSLGGIKSVTFTDIIQFFTFSIVIPLIAYILLNSIDNTDKIINVFTSNHLFNYQTILDSSYSQNLYYLSLFLCFAIPAFNPAIFQRIAMAKNVKQVNDSFFISAIICLFLLLIIGWISILLLSLNPNINADDVVKHIIHNYASVGTRGLILVGIIATIMSTADSYINATAVIIVHDFCKPLNIPLIKDELFSARVVSLLLGFFSIIFALIDTNLMSLLVLAYSFYMPIVSIPFIMALLGFRSTEKSVLLGMTAGIITVLLWDYILKITIANSVPIGMFANLVVLIGSHYLLKQSGGWVGIKDEKTLIAIRNERQNKLKKIIHDFKEFNIVEVCKRNYPNGEGLISILGFFVMIVTFSSVHNLSIKFHNQHSFLLDVLYPLTLCTSSALISYPLWLQQWKDSKFIAVIWNFIMFSVLICFSFLIVLISNFAEIQLIVFMINIVVIVSLIRWKWALFNIVLGVSITAILYNHYYFNSDILSNDTLTSQFKIVYLMLLTASSLVLFLKPKQQHQELTEDSNLFLSSKVEDQKNELSRLHALKNEFLRNLEHEAHTPITGITSMGQVLWENYDKFNEKQRRKATQEIAKSSERLNSLVNNLIDLSKLENLNYKLNKTKVNLTDLVYERIEICQKLYIEEKDKENLNFDLKIEDKLTVLCDEYYIARTIDNIVINAIQYCKKGTIAITLKSTKNHTVEFSVGDEGIGIPKEELLDIFDPFTVSSKTKTPAGGRGIGLTLCKKVITAHGGTITASSKNKGSLFRVILPQ